MFTCVSHVNQLAVLRTSPELVTRWLSLQFTRKNSVMYPADTRRRINVGLTLVHRLRRRTVVNPTLILRLVSAG